MHIYHFAMAENPAAAPPEDRLKPHLARFFEAAAAIMGLDHGRQRLELIFEDGHLTQRWAHHEKRPIATLAAFDEGAQWMVAHGERL